MAQQSECRLGHLSEFHTRQPPSDMMINVTFSWVSFDLLCSFLLLPWSNYKMDSITIPVVFHKRNMLGRSCGVIRPRGSMISPASLLHRVTVLEDH